MSDVDESLFDTPVYAALKKVYDNGILNPDVSIYQFRRPDSSRRLLTQKCSHVIVVQNERFPSQLRILSLIVRASVIEILLFLNFGNSKYYC